MARVGDRAKARLLLLCVVAVWGATFALIKDVLVDVSPLLFNLLRMAIASVVLLGIHARSLRGVTRRMWLAGAIAGVLLGAGYQLQTAGLARTTSAKSAFITGLVVVFVPMLTLIPNLRPRDAARPGWIVLLGALLAFAGLVLLTMPGEEPMAATLRGIGTGDLLTIGCAMAFAGHLLALGHFSGDVPAPVLATLQILFATTLMAVTLPMGVAVWVRWSPRLALALTVTSVLATATAFTVQSWAQQHLPPAQTAVLLTMEPVFALVISMLFLGERLGIRSLWGAALILCGIFTIELLPGSRPISPAGA